MVKLKGMTWSHPRGYDPMVACSALWREKTGVEISWEKRSLQDFESFPVDELAAAYDLIVIDHPHVGQITRENCLLSLDDAEFQTDIAAIAAGTVGRSYTSYNWQGRQWAFPIDAATQVQAYRPDRLSGPITDLEEIISLAADGKAILPMRPPHSLMTFYTLAAHLGFPCRVEGPELITRENGEVVLDWMARLIARMDSSWANRIAPMTFRRSSTVMSAIPLRNFGRYAWPSPIFPSSLAVLPMVRRLEEQALPFPPKRGRRTRRKHSRGGYLAG